MLIERVFNIRQTISEEKGHTWYTVTLIYLTRHFQPAKDNPLTQFDSERGGTQTSGYFDKYCYHQGAYPQNYVFRQNVWYLYLQNSNIIIKMDTNPPIIKIKNAEDVGPKLTGDKIKSELHFGFLWCQIWSSRFARPDSIIRKRLKYNKLLILDQLILITFRLPNAKHISVWTVLLSH